MMLCDASDESRPRFCQRKTGRPSRPRPVVGRPCQNVTPRVRPTEGCPGYGLGDRDGNLPPGGEVARIIRYAQIRLMVGTPVGLVADPKRVELRPVMGPD